MMGLSTPRPHPVSLYSIFFRHSPRARGRLGGRPRVEKESPKVRLAKKMHSDKSVPIEHICATLKISKATLDRYVQQ